jgi:SAM-dependent methyltransferase
MQLQTLDASFLRNFKIGITDDEFDAIFPERIRELAKTHWTPVAIAKLAADYLVEAPGTRVLDIGSGVGKFCVIGAAQTNGHFTGVEQRQELVNVARGVAAACWLPNVAFLNKNMMSIEFGDYDAFYFFNSFEEHVDVTIKIDDTQMLSPELYHSYSTYVCAQLALMPVGTRVATYFSPLDIIPGNYRLQHTLVGGNLRFWERVDLTEKVAEKDLLIK